MSDLISRKALIETIVNTPTEQSGYNPVYLNGCATRQNEIIDIITKLPPVEAAPQWIPCSERMPKHMTAVLVCTSAGEPFTAWYSHINKIWRNANTEMEVKADVIAWMPLPDPYKADMRKKV